MENADCCSPSPIAAKASDEIMLSYADAVSYDESMNPKDINWISDDIEAKIAPYKPEEILSGDNEVDPAAAEAAFTGIFAPRSGEIFVWFNQYQVEQTARKVAGWYGFALSSSAGSIFCPCGKPHTPLPKKRPISDEDFHGICDPDHVEKSKRNRTALSSIGCPFKFCVSHITSKDKCVKKIKKPVKITSFNFKHNHILNKEMLIKAKMATHQCKISREASFLSRRRWLASHNVEVTKTSPSPSKTVEPPPPKFRYTPLFELNPDTTTEYRQILPSSAVETISLPNGTSMLRIPGETMRTLSATAFGDISHLLRPAHLAQLRKILDDAEASDNDRFAAMELLKNANIASGRIFPVCQDSGTAIVMGERGHLVLTDGDDEEYLSGGAYDAYTKLNLRYSQLAPLTMFDEKNTGTNLPAQVDILGSKGDEYKFLFIAKGGGSANKTFLFQQTNALLNTGSLETFLEEKIKTIGTSACPPYHLAIVIGGLSAEQNLKTVKLASTEYYDTLPTEGDPEASGRAFRDLEWESRILEMTRNLGIGARFGGKYFCRDVRVVRLPRHGASCPVGIGVSCSADRQVKGKITKEGVFIEQLETDVSKYLPEVTDDHLDGTECDSVNIDLNSMSMDELRKTLSKYPVGTRLSLTGTIVVARDIAHAKMLRKIDSGEGLPEYAKNNIIYYAGPAKTPDGCVSGSFGPTTAGRMDAYVDTFMKNGGSFVTLAKGNRSRHVTNACKKYGGFYLGSIGGPAAILAKNSIKNATVLDNEEDGMEAIWKIDVENFPAFLAVDDKGDDFFKEWLG